MCANYAVASGFKDYTAPLYRSHLPLPAGTEGALAFDPGLDCRSPFLPLAMTSQNQLSEDNSMLKFTSSYTACLR